MIRSIWSPWRNQMGATERITKMVPWQHFDDPTTHRDVSAKESGRERVMQGWWGAPEFRVPTGRWHGKRGASQATTRSRCKHEHLIQPSMHSFTGGRHLGIIPSKHAFRGGSGSKRCRGSRRSRDGRSGSSGSRTSWK